MNILCNANIMCFSGLIPLGKKIQLMAGVLFTKQRKECKDPILDPDEFKGMLESAEPSLKGFFDQLYLGTNPQAKSHMTILAAHSLSIKIPTPPLQHLSHPQKSYPPSIPYPQSHPQYTANTFFCQI